MNRTRAANFNLTVRPFGFENVEYYNQASKFVRQRNIRTLK
jgi:hypothetical protein